MSGRWISDVPPPHRCEAPSERELAERGVGAKWECGECGTIWRVEHISGAPREPDVDYHHLVVAWRPPHLRNLPPVYAKDS